MENPGAETVNAIHMLQYVLSKVQFIVVDIEGTTTSISFVKDTLFNYIRNTLLSYLKNHWSDPQLKEDILLLKEQADQDVKNKIDGIISFPESADDDTMLQIVVNNVLWQMDLDRKTKALKQLQGHILSEGFKNEKLKGHIYADVVEALQLWVENGKKVYVYSSGSVEAQKLLFGYSEKGNLHLFSGHFDTTIGAKTEPQSYLNIIKAFNCESKNILFLTDVPKEAKAAQEAGLCPVLVVREGNVPLTEEDIRNFPVINSFHDLALIPT